MSQFKIWGKGKQCFIKTEFALLNSGEENNIDTLLLEEPENHLSHINMNKLVEKISKSHTNQKFITTHSSMICSRLNLRNAIMINSQNESILKLKDLPVDTANFFMKAPNNNVLKFILSKKVILVEGDAEYILMEQFFKTVSRVDLGFANVHIISVGGTSFKRYLDIAKILNIKVAVARDNDRNYNSNCVDNYADYTSSNIGIFYDTNNERYTFEVCLYNDNTEICDELFLPGRRSLSVVEYMLKNKADVAFKLLKEKGEEIYTPDYIRRAIEWIKD